MIMNSETLDSQQIKSWASEIGFQDCGIARARVLAEAEEEFRQSVEQAYNADMHYLERNIDASRFGPLASPYRAKVMASKIVVCPAPVSPVIRYRP